MATTHIHVFFPSGLKVMPLIAVCTVRTEGRFHRVQMYTNDTHGKNTEVWIVQTHFQRDLSAKTFYQFPPDLFWGVGSNLSDAARLLFSPHYQILKPASSMTCQEMENGEDHLKNAPKLAKRVFQTSAKSCFRGTPTLLSAPAATATTTSIFKLWNVLHF